MFTVCPKCTLTLVVTTVDLRAGQGYVRCGRCANVFNALIALREGDPSGSISDTANRRLQETTPRPPTEPAMGSGVAMDPEPEPAPEPEPVPDPEPEPEAELEPQPEPELEPGLMLEFQEPGNADPEETSLEFDAVATDVSEIFVPPPGSEHDTGSGNYESIVLAVEPDAPPANDPVEAPASEAGSALEEAGAPEAPGSDWSLLDDDEPPADDESVIEESPLGESALEAQEESLELDEPVAPDDFESAGDDPTTEQQAGDPAWVEEMFAEAEAEVERQRTAERLALNPTEAGEDTLIEAARSSTGAAAPSDTVLEPILTEPVPRLAGWPYIAGIAALSLALLLQIVHHHRQSLVLGDSVGPLLTRVYAWFGATITPRWDLLAYNVKQMGAEAEGGESNRLRVRLSLQNQSERVQPMPLLRLTLQDLYGNPVATRDLEPAEYLPPSRANSRVLEPDDRIDAELRVVDPGRKAIGFEIDACLRAENGAIGCAHDIRRRTPG